MSLLQGTLNSRHLKPDTWSAMLDPETILDVTVTRAGREDCVAHVASWLSGPPAALPRLACCVNPHSVMTARRDSGFAAVLEGSDLCVADGIGVVMASRILGGAVRERVTGSDLFQGVMARLDAGARSCFLLGATETTLAAMAARIAVEYPLVRIAGAYAPPHAEFFPADENDRMVAAVNAASPDVLWIGMTQPKQEKWAWLNRARLRTRVVVPVGAAFDFYAGRTRRPGAAAQRLGVEWLVRLSREPRRLWRRNLDSPAFLWLVLLSRLSRR